MGILDLETLKQIIANVEDSIELQGINVSSVQKAELIATLYDRSVSEGSIPSKMSTDQAVWMAH